MIFQKYYRRRSPINIAPYLRVYPVLYFLLKHLNPGQEQQRLPIY